jgi:hypothetical protein
MGPKPWPGNRHPTRQPPSSGAVAGDPSSRCRFCGEALGPRQRYCGQCGRAILLPPSASASFEAVAGPDSWDTVAEADLLEHGVYRGIERTRTGLLLMAVAFAFLWIPYLNVLADLLVLVGVVFLWLGRHSLGAAHRRTVVLGCVCVVASLGLGLITSLWFVDAVYTAVGSGGSSAQVSQSVVNAFYGLLVVAAVAGLLSVIAYLVLPYALADRTGRILLGCGAGLALAISWIAVLVTYSEVGAAVAATTSGGAVTADPLAALDTRVAAISVAQVVPDLLFLVAYERVRRTLGRPRQAASPGGSSPGPYARLE